MIYICENCNLEVDEVERPDQCTEQILMGGVKLGYVSMDMAIDAGEPDMEGMPITSESEVDICGGQFYMLGDII